MDLDLNPAFLNPDASVMDAESAELAVALAGDVVSCSDRYAGLTVEQVEDPNAVQMRFIVRTDTGQSYSDAVFITHDDAVCSAWKLAEEYLSTWPVVAVNPTVEGSSFERRLLISTAKVVSIEVQTRKIVPSPEDGRRKMMVPRERGELPPLSTIDTLIDHEINRSE